MRQARAEDFWRSVNKKKYDKSIDLIHFNGLHGIPDFPLGSGIHAICGLNGAGKSTIILSLKDILGIETSQYDTIKISGNQLDVLLTSNGEQKKYSNSDEVKFIKIDENKEKVWFVDQNKSLEAINYLCQENMEELLEQYDPYELVEQEVRELSFIIGKEYNSITLINIEDEDQGAIPYFKVNSFGTVYNSLKMGLGEHWLFYLWWAIYKAPTDSLGLIEEPESFIGIRSQEKLMDLIAMKSTTKGITFLLTTHSPYIIKNISLENITIISRYNNRVDVCKANSSGAILNDLGLVERKVGTIFVEDKLGLLFAVKILHMFNPKIIKKFNITIAGGEGEITRILEFPLANLLDYKIIGLYDGDIESSKGKCPANKIWKFDYLPTSNSVEEEFKETIKNNIDEFASVIGKDVGQVIRVLAKLDGDDTHDWYRSLENELSVDSHVLFEKIFRLWIESGTNKDNVSNFVGRLETLCDLVQHV